MALKLNGDFRRAIGFEDFEIGGVTISVSKLEPKWVKRFTDILFAKGNEEGKVKNFEKYFSDFFKENNEDKSISDSDIELFVSMYNVQLIEKFTVLFKIVDKDVYEKKKAEELLKIKKNDSPSD
jgi:hypothetical protein